MYSNKTKSVEVDMTRPQPCTKFCYVPAMEWVAKLIEETSEVVQEANGWKKIFETGGRYVYPDKAMVAQERLTEELTDVITVCTSWLAALGYDEEKRKELQRRVNEKNKARGYW